MNSSFNPNTDSEVFDEFIKIADDNIIKVVQEGDKSNVKDMKDLYDVSPDDKTGKELIEKAHPEKAETLESYLTDGGLVENQTEQQEVLMEVALKNPDLRIHTKTMAAKELADELVIIAEEMDVRGNTELASYADNILYRLNKVATPAHIALGIAAGVAAVIGGYYTLAHETDPVNFGVDTNIKSLVMLINNYKSSNPEIADMQVDVLSELNTIVSGVYRTREQYKTIMRKLTEQLKSVASVPSTKDELKNISSQLVASITQNKEANNIINKINKYSSMYNKYVSDILPELNRVKNYLSIYFSQTKDLAKSDTGTRDTLTQIWEKTKEYVGKTTKSIEDNLLDALTAFIKSLGDDLKLRMAEKEQLVSMLTSKVNYDISEQFKFEE